ncbi:sulfotransferase family protein [Salinisphaera hydrothermalis]|uniref:sulfotransferase family protein n=1 Tax=Salinisphaera hydrothermalis TaxID=563188 RepID=UPI003340E8D0
MSEAARMQDDLGANVPPPDPERSTVVAVLGAGRSGTSAITRGLSALGVDLGDNLRAGSGKNPTGFFEDRDVLATSKLLKRALGIRGHSLRLIDDAEFETPRIKAIQARAVEKLGQRFGETPLWGYKYSRTLRTLPFWAGIHEALNLDVRYLIALRNPLSVARSRSKINPQRGRQVWSDMEWLVNVVPYFDCLMGAPVAVVDFDHLMAEPEAQLSRVARDLGLPMGPERRAGVDEYAHRFLQKDKPSTRFTRDDLWADPQVNRWTAEGYTLLHRVASDELRLSDPEFTERWAQVATAVTDLGPLLAEFDYLRGELVSTGWNPASPVDQVRQVWRDLRSR